MVWGRIFTTLVASAGVYLPTAVMAAPITNPARPITYRVNVQLIQTALDDGSSPATVLGDDSQRADIENRVDTIWAQAGIDINFLPDVARFNNTFVAQGNAGAATRPTDDLGQILSVAATAGSVLNPDPTVIDMFFDNVTPGWAPEPANWVCGLSNVGTDGITEFIGSAIPTTDSGRDWAAHWISHEIGHNLGLYHAPVGSANLMNPTKRISEQLTPEQIDSVFQSSFHDDAVGYTPQGGTGFPQLISQPVLGDYNHDGAVNAADYTLWRATLGSNAVAAADGNTNGTIDPGDFSIWQSRFGANSQFPNLTGDFNRDGRVDVADYMVWRATLGTTVPLGSGADANLNGVIDSNDYAMWQSNFGANAPSTSVLGDFNRDGIVNAADYTIWRATSGTSVAVGTGADANLNGWIDSGDYAIWQANIGATLVSSVGAAAEGVPEPTTLLLAVVAAALLAKRRRRRR